MNKLQTIADLYASPIMPRPRRSHPPTWPDTAFGAGTSTTGLSTSEAMAGMRQTPVDLALPPGGFYFGDDQPRIRTLLGSCVSITLWNRQRRIGGMCHYLVPSRDSREYADPNPRYADEAMALFQRKTEEAGTPLASYEAKIFGGGSQFTGHGGLALSDIPARNVEAGLQLLAANGLAVAARHVGGQGPREVVFEVRTGDVWVRHENSLS